MTIKKGRLFESDFPNLWVALLLGMIPALFYWRHDLFFVWDDWTELDFLANKSFLNYLIAPDGEIFFPVFHLFFYFLVRLSGERHGILVFVNCIASGITAFLLYLFLKRNFKQYLALILSLLFAGSAMQQAIVWNAFYLCYILSLIFFLLAILSTDRYLQSSSPATLVIICLFSFLSIHSHNYTLLALLALPGYIAVKEGIRSKKLFILSGIIGGIIGLFIFEYLLFAGTKAPTLYNKEVLSSFPGDKFLFYWFYGAFLSPLKFLFIGHYQFPIFGVILGLAVFTLLLFVIFYLGKPQDKRFTLWALSLNALPFLLLSLGRHQFGLEQAFAVRYVFFTLIGTLLLIATAWTVLTQQTSKGFVKNPIILVLPVAITVCQVLSLPAWQEGYLNLTRQAIACYEKPVLITACSQFWLTPHYPLKPEQMDAIKQFLKEGRKTITISKYYSK